MGYEGKAQKGFSVFTGTVLSFLMLSSSCLAATANQAAAPDTTVKPVDTAKTDKVANTAKTDKAATTTETKSDDKTVQANTSDTSAAADEFKTEPAIADPYEPYNRIMFNFNDRVDITVLKPVATFYNKIMPKPLNQGVHNFFNNINNVPTIINDLLQFNFYQMSSDLWRFGINTTVGIGGLFDVASRMNLQQYDNDFGLTLAKWGYRNSNYFVLPFWGPKTVRDVASMPVDYFTFSVYPYIHPTSTRYEIYGLGVIDFRAQHLKVENVTDEATLDKYVFMRNAYMQNRAYKINQNDHRTFADLDKGAPVPDIDTTDDGKNQPAAVADGTFIPDEANSVGDKTAEKKPASDDKISA